MKYLLLALLFTPSIFEVKEVKASVAEFIIVLPYKFSFHKLPFVGKFCSKTFAFGFNDGDLMDFPIGIATNQQEVREIVTNIAPMISRPFETSYPEFREVVITVEIDLKIPVAYDWEYFFEETAFKCTVKSVGQIMVCANPLRVRIFLGQNAGDIKPLRPQLIYEFHLFLCKLFVFGIGIPVNNLLYIILRRIEIRTVSNW